RAAVGKGDEGGPSARAGAHRIREEGARRTARGEAGGITDPAAANRDQPAPCPPRGTASRLSHRRPSSLAPGGPPRGTTIDATGFAIGAERRGPRWIILRSIGMGNRSAQTTGGARMNPEKSNLKVRDLIRHSLHLNEDAGLTDDE